MVNVRLIDANALKVRMFRSKEFNYETGSFDLPVVPWHDIEDADTIDAVEVVRCRKCYYRDKPSCCPYQYSGFKVEPDWYCPMGVKMDAKEMDVHTKDGGADNV